ncbi:MAG: UDP-N-acetylmuramate--L-alanine ligase [Gilvibacter sp.]
MNNLAHISHFYFIGIGGIGMSALARYFNAQGKNVAGYDKTPSRLTGELQDEGIVIQFEDVIDNIPSPYLDKDKTLVVYTPAIPSSHLQLGFFKTEQFKVVKRAELLGWITKETTCLAVAGTHGKTTTSAILGHLLAACDVPVTAFLGGICENYQSNIIINGSEVTVVEADEFDRSFLNLSPDIACVTSMDADHLDIYNTHQALQESFKEFASLVPDNGTLFKSNGLPIEGQSVGIEDDAQFRAENVRIKDGGYLFDLVTPNEHLKNLQFFLPGHHNLLNAVTALGMAIAIGSPTHCLPKALHDFKGVRRRFSYRIKTDDLVVIDDYAHHPSEIDAVFQAVTEFYPEQKKLVVFQPHLFSRTRDFGPQFAKSLAAFDSVLLLDIYPARELPIKGVDSSWLLDQINHSNKRLISKSAIAEQIKKSGCSIVLLLGAGDIGEEVVHIVNRLNEE